MASNPARVQSIDRAVTVLEMLACSRWAGVSEVARGLDVHRSTAYRILATLTDRGIVRQDPDTEKYALGPGLLQLARSASSDQDLVELARPICQTLCGELKETITLAVLKDGQATVVCQSLPSNSVLTVDWSGTQAPLHTTAGGKVLLAFLSAGHRKKLIAEPLEKRTPQTITTLHELERQLIEIWDEGYGVTVGELEEGLNAVSAPVRDARGKVVAALTASGPEFRLLPERLHQIAPKVKAAAAQLESLLSVD